MEGKTSDEIVEMCDGDERLVYASMEFLKDIEWLKKSRIDAISSDVTTKGIAVIQKYGENTIKRLTKTHLVPRHVTLD